MYKKHFIFIIGIFVGSILFFIFLVGNASIPNKEKNGFERRWLNESLSLNNSVKIDKAITRICGATANHYFLAGRNPQFLLLLNNNLQVTDTQFFNIRVNEDILSRNMIFVDSPSVSLHAYNKSQVFSGKLNGFLIDSFRLPTGIVLRSDRISKNKIVTRSLDSTGEHQDFEIFEINRSKALYKSSIISSEESDGWDSDGQVKYDSSTKRLFYIQYYKNRFYCIDTNLNLVYKGRTIDTVQFNNITYKAIIEKDGSKLVPTKARVATNRSFWVNNGFIYVLSGLRADNESLNSFREASIFDVYSGSNGEYVGSFSIPNLSHGKLIDVLITKDEFLVLFSGYLASYTLHIGA